jgi:hypothetical protein
MNELCSQLLRADFKLHIRAGGRVDLFSRLDETTLRLMKKAGFYHFGFGVESGSETTLDMIKKNLSAADPEKICLGALATEFNDALWPVGCYHYQMGGVFDYNDIGHETRYKEYDTDGMYFKGGAPDDVVNIEYMGVVDADRKPKLAYTELQRIYKELDDVAPKPIEEISDKK